MAQPSRERSRPLGATHAARGTAPACLAALALLALSPARGRAAETPADSSAHATPAPTFPDPGVRAWQVGLLRPDRLQHASLSFTLSLSLGLLSRRPEVALIGGLGLGLAKEFYDARRTVFDPVDLAADAIGVAAATGITAALEE